MIDISLEIIDQSPVILAVDDTGAALTMQLADPFVGGMLPAYEGAYEVTPAPYAQTLATERRSMFQDVVINPIPSNYGLITWDGSVLTVS